MREPGVAEFMDVYSRWREMEDAIGPCAEVSERQYIVTVTVTASQDSTVLSLENLGC